MINTNPTKTGSKHKCSGRVNSSSPTSGIRRVTIKRHEHHVTWKSCWPPYILKYVQITDKTWTPYKKRE